MKNTTQLSTKENNFNEKHNLLLVAIKKSITTD